VGAGSGPDRGRCARDLPTLQSESDRPGPSGARAGFLLAHCLEQVGRIGEAQATFDTTAGRYAPLAGYAQLRAAALAMKAEATADASARLARILAGPISPPLQRRIRLLQAEILTRQGATTEAARVLRSVLQTPPPESMLDDEPLARAWWSLGRAADAAGDRGLAGRALTVAWWAFPGTAVSFAAAARLRTMSDGPLPTPPPEARARRAVHLLALGERGAAERELVAAVRGGLAPETLADAWYRLGQLRLGSPEGVYAFSRAVALDAADPRARYWLGRALAAAGRRGDAQTEWIRISREHPDTVWAARSLLALGLSAEAAGSWGASDAIFADLIKLHPRSRQADEARWRRGWIRYRRGQFVEAEALFIRAADEAPGAYRAAASLSWAARVRERRGQSGRALLERLARTYPHTYYGERARRRLGWPQPGRVTPGPTSPQSTHLFASAAAELTALGFDREAADEAEALPLEDADAATLRAVAISSARLGELPDSATAAEGAIRLSPQGWARIDAELWKLAYPRAYWEQIQAAAPEGLDPYLVLAVMREESRFDPRAVSSAGAVGLMQVLPGTARGLAGGTRVAPEHLMDAATNIRYGITYLRRSLRTFGNDVPLALAAYNAGPAAARRFARRRGGDADLFIETIPYAETRAYVQRVLESYSIYRWLYR
jgi:soluble lytic murein transglycosylase